MRDENHALSMNAQPAADESRPAALESAPAPESAEPNKTDGTLNPVATALAGRPIVGPVAIFFNTASCYRHMYQLLRPEAVLKSRPTKLSSDTYIRAFGTTVEDEIEVLRASEAAISLLPAVAAELDELASKAPALD